jgi:hypothetical protein
MGRFLGFSEEITGFLMGIKQAKHKIASYGFKQAEQRTIAQLRCE